MRRQVTFVCLIALLLAVAVTAAPITVTGTVLGPDGKPVAGAQVLAMTFAADKGTLPVDVLTDAAGAFTLHSEPVPYGPPNGGLAVLARKDGLAMALGRAKPGVPLILKLGDKPEMRSGVVTDAAGKPLAQVPVNLFYLSATDGGPGAAGPRLGFNVAGGAWAKATTDEQGRFSFSGFSPELAATVGIEAEGCAGVRINLPTAVPVTVALQPEATISGKVLVNGQPRANVEVYAYAQRTDGSGWPGRTMTETDGAYTIGHLAGGPTAVVVTPVADTARTPEQVVTLKAGQAVTGVDFSLTRGAVIRGKVTEVPTGKPVQRAHISASATDGRYSGGVQPDAEGRYELRLQPGTYRLQCRATGSADYALRGGAEKSQITVAEGDVIEGKDFAIKLPRILHGQVLLPDGQPATGAQVKTMGGFMGGLPPQLDPEARLELTVPDLPPGANAEDYGDAILIATEPEKNLAALLSLKNLPDPFTVKLQPAATVTVLVTDEQSQPLKGFGVSVGYPMGEHGTISEGAAQSDALGMIRLTCLPAGLPLRLLPDQSMRNLMVSDDLGKTPITLAPGEGRLLPPVIVNANGRSLNVFVGSADGKPVKGAQIYAPGAQEPATTDEQGKVTLAKLPLKGKVPLLAKHPTEEWYAFETVDPDAGVWPGLIVKPMAKATGVVVAKGTGKPLEGVQVMCQQGYELWQLGYQIIEKLGLMRPGQQRATTDAAGRWHLTNLLPGVTYQVSAQGQMPGQVSIVYRMIGSFKAEGGTDEQDVGTMETDPPAATAPGAPDGPKALVPPPPPPPAQ